MRVEVINTGTELLLGTTQNTHAAWLGQRLFPLGLRITRQICIPDGEEIRQALVESMPRCEVILVTGGLGPTSDDITREITASLLDMPLSENAEVYEQIRARLARRRREMNEHTRRQAMVPAGATVLPNPNGTAPGLYFPASREKITPHIFLLPGPPRELHPMFLDHVAPRLAALRGVGEVPQRREFILFGPGESQISTTLEDRLVATGLAELGYCVRLGQVTVRCIGTDAQLDACEHLVRDAFPADFVTAEDMSLEAVVVDLLSRRGEKVATAESCTGGLVAHLLTNVPGASAVFDQGVVSYANEAKRRLLAVPAELLTAHGAVSEPVARAMAEGALHSAGADHAIALTGIAGPDGGSVDKPVGTVFIAVASRNAPTRVLRELFSLDRPSFKEMAARVALDRLRRRLSGHDA